MIETYKFQAKVSISFSEVIEALENYHDREVADFILAILKQQDRPETEKILLNWLEKRKDGGLVELWFVYYPILGLEGFFSRGIK